VVYIAYNDKEKNEKKEILDEKNNKIKKTQKEIKFIEKKLKDLKKELDSTQDKIDLLIKKAEGFNPGEKGYPSNGRIAFSLWGGDAGYSWSKKERDKIMREREND
jgi:predicted nuclease with TOPRIM domain